jgi:hypothetical protein
MTKASGILPGVIAVSDHLREPHRSNSITECRTIRFVSVPQQIAVQCPTERARSFRRKASLAWN